MTELPDDYEMGELHIKNPEPMSEVQSSLESWIEGFKSPESVTSSMESQFPSNDSKSRAERAEEVVIEDIRRIDASEWYDGEAFTVYELDLINDRGERRENITVIPRILFESTKDVQYRHSKGVVGKYTLALAREDEDAREELLTAIKAKRSEAQDKIREYRNKDSRLLHTQAEVTFAEQSEESESEEVEFTPFA